MANHPHHPSRFLRRASTLALAAAALSGASTAALAQDAAPQPGVQSTAPGQVPEVVVTATRRSEKEQDVPVSTSVIAPAQVVNIFSAGGDVRALANTVPSLNIE